VNKKRGMEIGGGGGQDPGDLGEEENGGIKKEGKMEISLLCSFLLCMI
jgi:hypothetical protein